MKKKIQVKQFIEDNYCIINSLMSKKEQQLFNYDVCKFIIQGIDELIKKEKENKND